MFTWAGKSDKQPKVQFLASASMVHEFGHESVEGDASGHIGAKKTKPPRIFSTLSTVERVVFM